jgi:predicted nuclease of predicted toxin-antitoxin system
MHYISAIAAANNLRLVTADEALGKSAEIIGVEFQILRIIVD